MSDVVFRSEAARADIMARYRAVQDSWPVAAEKRILATTLGDTFVLSCGPVHAPPLVLLHGAQANSAAWLPDIEIWSRHFRIYCVDMIGEAGMSAPVRPSLEGRVYASWLNEIFEGLEIDQAMVAGTSLGGWLALAFAVHYSRKVASLALICPAGIGRQKNLLLKAAPLLLLGPWGLSKIREMVFGPAPDVFPAALALIAPLMDAIGAGTRPRIVSIPRLSDAQLQALHMPLLAIVGGRDALINSRETRARLKANAPRAEICFLENGFHFLPDQTQRVLDFLLRTLPEQLDG